MVAKSELVHTIPKALLEGKPGFAVGQTQLSIPLLHEEIVAFIPS